MMPGWGSYLCPSKPVVPIITAPLTWEDNPDFKDNLCRVQCILSRKQVARLWPPSANTTTDFLQSLFLYIHQCCEVKRKMLSLLKTVQILVGALEELVYNFEAVLSAGKLAT